MRDPPAGTRAHPHGGKRGVSEDSPLTPTIEILHSRMSIKPAKIPASNSQNFISGFAKTLFLPADELYSRDDPFRSGVYGENHS